MGQQNKIQLFGQKKVRAVWDAEQESRTRKMVLLHH